MDTADTAVKPRYCKSKFLAVAVVSILALGGLAFFLLVSTNEVSTGKQQTELRNGATQITIGDYNICALERIDFDANVPIYSDGELIDTYTSENDILFEGYVCGTSQETGYFGR